MGLGLALGCQVDAPILISDQVTMYDLMIKNIALNALQSRAKELILNWYELSYRQKYVALIRIQG